MRTFLATVCAIVLCPSALGQFDTATTEATVIARTTVDSGTGPVEDLMGGLFPSIYPLLGESASSGQTTLAGTANAGASLNSDMTPTRILASAFVNTDTDGFSDFGSADSSGISLVLVRFVISESHRWTFRMGSLTGTHAGGSVSMNLVGTLGRSAPVFFFDSISTPDFTDETGVIAPGQYEFTAEVSAYTFSGDGFNGLFADASFDIDFEIEPLAPPPCPGDADGNGVVNFADITNVLTNFGMDYTPGTGAGDADRNGVVNFADITNVLTNFGFTCPA